MVRPGLPHKGIGHEPIQHKSPKQGKEITSQIPSRNLMPYYGVASGRNVGVYDNWDECKEQVDGYSRNDYKKFESPDAAWDFVDQRSGSKGNSYVQDYSSKAVVPRRGNNQSVVAKNNSGEARAYQRTDYMEGRNGIVMRERSYTSGRQGNGYYVEKRTRTYWEKD